MTHQEEYDKIINFRKSNPLPKDQYGEKHHIVPKSICPLLKDAPDNIIRLSAQEHFLAHYHLWLAYRDELKDKTCAKKMCYALCRMKQELMKCDDIVEMSKLYEEARIEQAKSENNPFFGKHQSEEVKQKLRKPRSEEIKKKISQSLKGKHLSEEARNKISKRLKGKQHSKEHCKKISEANKGKPKSKEARKKLSQSRIGLRHYNNGVINILAKECPDGFVHGMLPRPK